VVACVDAAAGKHVRSAHERGVFVPAHHEGFRAASAVAEDDNGCGRTGVCNEGVRGHGGQY